MLGLKVNNGVFTHLKVSNGTMKIGRNYSLTNKSDFPGKAFQQYDPATGDKAAKVPSDNKDSIQRKFANAKKQQKAWADVSMSEKKKIFEKYAEKLSQNAQELAASLSKESGKPITQARNEIKGTIPRVKYFINEVEKVMENRVGRTIESREEFVSWEPLGVIANISAWNYPFFVGHNVFVPALLTGNTVLYKPSEYVSNTCYKLVQLAWESGVPKDAFIPILGDGKVGAKLLDQDINGVFFTGSNRAGKLISKHVAEKFIRVQLELGGKDPVYVAEDVADLKAVAAAVADGAFYNTGQSCCSVERIYVHESVYEEFVKHVVEEVKTYKVGNPSEDSTYIGPLTLPNQKKLLLEQVEEAVSKGAKVLVGGKIMEKPGNWFEPTVIVNASQQTRVVQEESFGPIVPIIPVKNDDHAIELMNDSIYALTSSIYTSNRNRAEYLLKRMESGTVYWNACDCVSPYIPWNGRKGSGIGSTLGHEGIRALLQPKSWHMVHPKK